MKTHPIHLCLIALLGLSLSGCAAIYRITRPVNDALTAPFVDLPDDPGVHKPDESQQRGAGSTSKPRTSYQGKQGESVPASEPIIRAQSPGGSTPGSGDIYGRGPMRATDATSPQVNRYAQPGAPILGQPTAQPAPQETYTAPPNLPAPPADALPPGGLPFQDPTAPETLQEALTRPSDLDIFVQEARTGKFSFGVAVNSNAGLTGQITVEERNFDLFRWARNWDDVMNGGAFRGGGQYLRLEAYPGSKFQRYMISLTEPYLLGTNISGTTSASYFDRNYFDYFESRYGGTIGLGYRLTPDLSVQSNLRMENVGISNPRVPGVPELVNALGRHDLFGGKFRIMHDTRDLPMAPTEGHYFDISYEQVFGSFDYGRAEMDYSQYYTLRERPDGSGRHILAFSTQLGFQGSDSPIFEHYFAGGYNTLRGFAFRGASPVDNTVRIGGRFKFINSVEYFFPLTADDMVKGVVFCDFGAVESTASFSDPFRVAPGAGLRINVPALGPAPLALDFAFPVSYASTDQKQTFSFFFGVSRQ
ncbi:MAG: BamA/TamA family outer membrane protein [Planctomycetales bacterium]|nr:BamA/TamA family outer membrane protein [Planctomycetales bacterium]